MVTVVLTVLLEFTALVVIVWRYRALGRALAIAELDNKALREALALRELGTDTVPGFDVDEFIEETLPGANELQARSSTLRPPAIPRELKKTIRSSRPGNDGPQGAA